MGPGLCMVGLRHECGVLGLRHGCGVMGVREVCGRVLCRRQKTEPPYDSPPCLPPPPPPDRLPAAFPTVGAASMGSSVLHQQLWRLTQPSQHTPHIRGEVEDNDEMTRLRAALAKDAAVVAVAAATAEAEAPHSMSNCAAAAATGSATTYSATTATSTVGWPSAAPHPDEGADPATPAAPAAPPPPSWVYCQDEEVCAWVGGWGRGVWVAHGWCF